MNDNTADQEPIALWLTWQIGQRVVVRRKLPSGSSHLYTDLTGTVVKTGGHGVILQTATGQIDIPGEEIAIGKPIPPRPQRRRPRTNTGE